MYNYMYLCRNKNLVKKSCKKSCIAYVCCIQWQRPPGGRWWPTFRASFSSGPSLSRLWLHFASGFKRGRTWKKQVGFFSSKICSLLFMFSRFSTRIPEEIAWKIMKMKRRINVMHTKTSGWSWVKHFQFHCINQGLIDNSELRTITQVYIPKRRTLIQVLPPLEFLCYLLMHMRMHEQIWCTHWLEEVPVWVYAFWVCKPVIRECSWNTLACVAPYIQCQTY